jgi:hypothetical protein
MTKGARARSKIAKTVGKAPDIGCLGCSIATPKAAVQPIDVVRPMLASVDLLAADVTSKHWTEPVPTEAHGLVADINAALRRSSTFRNDSRKRRYIITTSRINSGDELNRRNGLGGFALDLRGIRRGYRRQSSDAMSL